AERFAGLEDGRGVLIGVRPEDIVPEGHGVTPRAAHRFEAPVALTESLGNETLLLVPFAGREVMCRMQQPRPVEIGERMNFLVNADRIHIFDEESGRSLRRH
ncbi:MAG: TOBE domain-containing protein, partial [Methylobacteriaceae bacterium]|nr:TOBE domain-containing protein [Methylobacteriaceae bacterium]